MSPASRLTPAEEVAFRAVFDAHAAAVLGFLLRLTRDRRTAEDLFQDTWLDCVRAFPALDRSHPLRPWLLKAARNRWRMHRRWSLVDPSRWWVAETPVDLADGSDSPETSLGQAKQLRHLETALGKLRPADREVVLLALDDSLAPSERAGVLGLSEPAFRQRLHRARAKLERLLTDEEDR